MGKKRIDFDTFKRLARQMDWEPEFTLRFAEDPHDYMIITYADYVTFQRCGQPGEGSGEIRFSDLDELYNADTIDGICLKRDWDGLECIIQDCDNDLFDEDDMECALEEARVRMRGAGRR